MPNKKTLYIVGAGASSEAKMPTGNELKDKIAKYLDIRFEHGGFSQLSGDAYIVSALRIHAKQEGIDRGDINPHLHAARRIRDAMPQAISIDNFIDTHSDDKKIELCGKLAIVRSILDAEKNSMLYIDNPNNYNKLNFSSLKKIWYSSFMMLLTENCKKEDLSSRLRSIALIVFNYDRCIEHFLYNSLMNYYGIQPEEAAKFINEIEIYHPYGVVGNLPWQGDQSVEFGSQPEANKLLELAGQIKTFTEGTDPNSSEILAIQKNVTDSEKIVFLGFAFHELNMKLMSPDKKIPTRFKPTAYFGTADGISDSDCDIIKSELRDFKNNNLKGIYINNKLKCAGFFKEYWRSLSLN